MAISDNWDVIMYNGGALLFCTMTNYTVEGSLRKFGIGFYETRKKHARWMGE